MKNTEKTLTLNVITKHADGRTTTEQKNGVNLVSVHDQFRKISRKNGEARKIQIDLKNGGENLDFYSLFRAALHVASNATQKSTDPTMIRARIDLWKVNDRLIMPEYIGGGVELLQTLICDLCSQEARDLYSVAYGAMFEKYAENPAAENSDFYEAGYKSVNGYLMAERRNHAREMSLEWIEESGGELVSENDYQARIIHGGERYNPAPAVSADLTVDARAEIAATVSAAAATLTERQKEALALVEKHSYSQIADIMNITKCTAADHVSTARAKIVDYIAQNSPDLLEYVHALPIIEKARAVADRKRTKKSGENFHAATENARYTYGKYYKVVEKSDFAALAEKLSADVKAARADYFSAAENLEKVKAAAGITEKQAARATAYFKRAHAMEVSAAERCAEKARAIISAEYTIMQAAATKRAAEKELISREIELANIYKPRKKPAKKSKKI